MSVMQRASALFVTDAAGAMVDRPESGRTAAVKPALVKLSVFDTLAAIERDWLAFEREADCTVFQTFAWQSAWMKHMAPHEAVTPAIVTGRGPDGALLFILPLALRRTRACRLLTWLATDLCDYNAPLLAGDFREQVGAVRFPALWREIVGLLRADPRYRPDAVLLGKMPDVVGTQPNPFLALSVAANPNSAYLTHLGSNWEEFYRARRSSATRRRDRTKRKRLGDMGEVRVVTPDSAGEIDETLSTLFAQKARSFARMGAPNIFAIPGQAEFYRELATSVATRQLVHVSRLNVGKTLAAANFGLIFRNRYHHILASYDDGEVSRFGPGAAHLHDLMQYAIDKGCDAFDFTIGDDGYKRDWSDTVIGLYDYRSALDWRGSLVTLPSAMLSRIKRTIKQTPALWRVAGRLRALRGSRPGRPPAED